MPFPSALSAGNLTSLRGDASTNPTYRAPQYLSLCPNTTVFKALVNQASFTASYAQVTFDNVTTGAYTDIQVGQTVYIYDPASSKRAPKFVGRVRKTPTSSILYINETSATIDDNDVIEVVHDFRLWDKLARESGGVQLKDYDRTYTQTPPVVAGLQSAYAGVVSGDPAGYTQAFAATGVPATSGASISSYAYTIASGMTVVAGDEDTASVTIRFDAGFYWLKLVVTDSNGLTTTLQIPVWAVPADFSAQVALGFEGAQIEGLVESGYTASITAFDGISSVLDGTLCCVWGIEYYNGVQGSLISNVQFVGRLRREVNTSSTDETYSLLKETAYELEGIGAQLARTTAPLLALRNKNAPSVWDQIKDMTLWREAAHILHEHTTFLSLHSLSFDSTDNTFRDKIYGTQGENALDVVNDLASGINAALEFTPQGEARMVRDARYLSSSERDALVVPIDFTAQDWIGFSLEREHVDPVGRVEASGGMFSTLTNKVSAFLSVAPGTAQGSGQGKTSLARQILASNVSQSTAQAELNTRAGYHYVKENTAWRLTAQHPDGYHWITPSLYQWYTFTIAASENSAGRAFTTADRWQCIAISIGHDNATGAKTVEATYVLEPDTEAAAGQTVQFPAIDEEEDPGTGIPPEPSYPTFPPLPEIILPVIPIEDLPPYLNDGTVPTDGNAVTIWTGEHVWSTLNGLALEPDWRDITPPIDEDSVIKHAKEGLDREYYVLVANESTSVVFYTPDRFASDVTWEEGEAISGEWDAVEPTSTAGQVYIYDNEGGFGPEELDANYWLGEKVFISIQVGDQTDAFDQDRTQAMPVPGTGAIGILEDVTHFGDAGINYQNQADGGLWYITLFPTTSGSGEFHRKRLHFVNRVTDGAAVTALLSGYSNHSASVGQNIAANLASRSEIGWNYQGETSNTVNMRSEGFIRIIYRASLAPFPGGTPSECRTAFSDNYGETWDSPVDHGDPPEGGQLGGIGAVKIGDLLLVGSNKQTKQTTSAGGSANYGTLIPQPNGQPHAILIPRYQFSGSANNAVSNPHYLVGSGTLVGGTAALWKATNDGSLYTHITPTSGGTVGVAGHPHCLAMPWYSGSVMAVVYKFGTTPRLLTSINAGGSWTDRGTMTASGRMVAFRKGDTTMQQLWGADQKPFYSPNFGLTRVYKNFPAEGSLEPVLGVSPFG